MHQGKSITHPYLTFLFLALVFWLPLPLGSNRAWAWSMMEIWIFVIAISTLILVYKNKLTVPESVAKAKPVLLLIAGFLVWTGIQIIPLPVNLLQLISPHAAKIATASGNIGYASIAIDPDLTVKSLLKGLSFITLIILMLILIDSHKKIRWLAYTVLVAGLFQAAFGSWMVLSGMEYSFFIEKEAYRGFATGTFINRNHLAGYLEMVLAVGIGLLISNLSNERSRDWRDRLRRLSETLLSPKALIRVTLIVICIGLILTKSRMGNAAFFSSLIISGLLFLLIARHATRSTTIFLISLVVLDIILIGSWVGVGKVVQRMENTSAATEHRDEVARDTISMIKEQPLTGIGGGNYSSVFPNYQQLDVWDNYYHAHNDYLEFLSEYGLIGTMCLAAAVFYCLLMAFQAMRRRHSALMQGMAFASFMGIVSILIHSSVDFNLQVPANAAMFILLMGLSVIVTTTDHIHR